MEDRAAQVVRCEDCKERRHLKSEESNMCDLLRINTDQVVMLNDGQSRFSIRGQPIHHVLRTSTFSEYTVVDVGSIAKINHAATLDKVCVLSCGISTGDADLIRKTCKTTNYYDLCVSSLKSNATSTAADTKGLAAIMIGVGAANATATSSYLSSQLLSSTNDAVTKKVLKDCADKYSYANDALRSSLQDLSTEMYDYAFIHVTAAADYPNACHNAFKRYKGLAYPPELARREAGLRHICDVVLGMLNLVGGGYEYLSIELF